MAFSVFSSPLTSARLAMYGGGAAVGTGAGAMLAGRNHRTAGAVAGSSIGIGAAAYHAYGHNLPDVVDNISRGARDLTDGKLRSAGDWAKYAGIKAMRNPNVDTALTNDASHVVSAVKGIMGRFRG